jgi:hypothetical protein
VYAAPLHGAASATQPERPEMLEGKGCETSVLDAVRAQLRVELANQAPFPDGMRVRLSCAATVVEIVVFEHDGNRELIRQRVDLRATKQQLKPRIVALTIVELIREAEALDGAPSRTVEPPATADRKNLAAEPPIERERRAIALLAFAQASSFRFETPLAWGAGLRLDYGVTRFALGLDSTIARGTEPRSLGSITTTVVAMSVHAAWAPRAGDLFARLGLGHAFGVGRISGDAHAPGARGQVVTGAWGAPYALAAFGNEFGPVRVELRGQLGWVTFPVEGLVSEGHTVRLGGAWSCLQLGAGLTF